MLVVTINDKVINRFINHKVEGDEQNVTHGEQNIIVAREVQHGDAHEVQNRNVNYDIFDIPSDYVCCTCYVKSNLYRNTTFFMVHSTAHIKFSSVILALYICIVLERNIKQGVSNFFVSDYQIISYGLMTLTLRCAVLS